MTAPPGVATLLLATWCSLASAQASPAPAGAWVAEGERIDAAADAIGISVVRVGDTRWRLFWADGRSGVRSAVSPDLEHWTPEPGTRVAGANLRYPSTLADGEDLWLFVQESLGERSARIRQYRSTDHGLTWSDQGVAIDREQGFDFAGSSAAFVDGRRERVLLFSGTPSGRGGPSGLYRARLVDGERWEVETRPIFDDAHSPTVVPLGPGHLELLFRRGAVVAGARSRDGGLTWQESGTVRVGADALRPEDGAAVTIDADDAVVLLATQGGGLVAYRPRPAEPSGGDAGAGSASSGRMPDGFPDTFRDVGVVIGRSASGRPVAPDIVRLADGRYRMFFLLPTVGIGSAVSSDGLSWSFEPGARLAQVAEPGTPDGLCGHPTVVRQGRRTLRMIYQGVDPASVYDPEADDSLRLFTAISRDEGLTWKRQGLAIGTGEPWGLDTAGHGRAWVRDDGTLVLFFSGNPVGDDGASSIMMATSIDGRRWAVEPKPLFEHGHDPALVQLDGGRLVMVYAHLKDGFRVAWSEDEGRTWSEPARLSEQDAAGRAIVPGGEREDVALLVLPTGEILLFLSTDRGIVLARPAVPVAPAP